MYQQIYTPGGTTVVKYLIQYKKPPVTWLKMDQEAIRCGLANLEKHQANSWWFQANTLPAGWSSLVEASGGSSLG